MEGSEFVYEAWNDNGSGNGNGNQFREKTSHNHVSAEFNIFQVDDLLDFSNEDIAGYIGDGDSDNCNNNNMLWSSCNSSPKTIITDIDSNDFGNKTNQSKSSTDVPSNLNSPHQTQSNHDQHHHLCVPDDDLGDLDWLSNFVEDSFSEQESAGGGGGSLLEMDPSCLVEFQTRDVVGSNSNSSNSSWVMSETDDPSSTSRKSAANVLFTLETPVPGRARSKRSRISACNISSRIVWPPFQTSNSDVFPTVKKKPFYRYTEDSRCGEAVRKCSHCETTKTPQWRTGPMGPKTLCNACGVRYKSGRLVPEYRPAASPTFMPSIHSNSHRKVLEMRRLKERREHLALFHSHPHSHSHSRSNSNSDSHCRSRFTQDDEAEDENPNSGSTKRGYSSSWFSFGTDDIDFGDDETYLIATNHDYRHLIL